MRRRGFRDVLPECEGWKRARWGTVNGPNAPANGRVGIGPVGGSARRECEGDEHGPRRGAADLSAAAWRSSLAIVCPGGGTWTGRLGGRARTHDGADSEGGVPDGEWDELVAGGGVGAGRVGQDWKKGWARSRRV